MKKEEKIENKKQEIKEQDEWNEIEEPDFFKFEQLNDKLEGVLLSQEINENYGFGDYSLRTNDGKTIKFHGSTQLDDLLLNLEMPCPIKIIFVDLRNTPNGQMKVFKVFTK